MESGKSHRFIRGAVAALVCLAALSCLPAASGADLPRLKAEADLERGGRIVDDLGREVLLRGVNVNSLGQYWKGTSLPPVLPFDRRDPVRIAGMGWNVVRLIVSWSRVEPRPGAYDQAYLSRVESVVRRLEEQGVYSIIDFHQDAWGATLAARPDEVCPPPQQPGFGWDGAPEWATFDDGNSRCYLTAREINPAVRSAWASFFADRKAAGGVGIQTRYVRMLRHVAKRFARSSAVAGIDIMNEPNAFGPEQNSALGPFYARAVKSIRSGEKSGRGFRHMILFEPSVLWSLTGSGAPPPFTGDRNIVYSPHLYGGSIGAVGPPSRPSFETAMEEAKAFGGVPVLTGEWGGDPTRATGRDDDYFNTHQALQDEFRIGATLWTWKQSCGDPHAASHDGSAPPLPPWSLYRMDCEDGGNRIVGQFRRLRQDLRRGYVRRAPGRLVSTSYRQAGMVFRASGSGNRRGYGPLEVFYPEVTGLKLKIRQPLPGASVTTRVIGRGMILTIPIKPGKWSVEIRRTSAG